MPSVVSYCKTPVIIMSGFDFNFIYFIHKIHSKRKNIFYPGFFFLLRKIALPYPHKCLLGFVEAKRGDQQEYLKIILVREVNPVVGWTCREILIQFLVVEEATREVFSTLPVSKMADAFFRIHRVRAKKKEV